METLKNLLEAKGNKFTYSFPYLDIGGRLRTIQPRVSLLRISSLHSFLTPCAMTLTMHRIPITIGSFYPKDMPHLFFTPLMPRRGLSPSDKLHTLRQIDSILEGHPTPRFEWTEVATGSLGQGLSLGLGMALNGKYLDASDYPRLCPPRRW